MEEIPPEFICPISFAVMDDPVICDDGHTYDRQAILEWFKQRETSPITNLPISTKLIPNVALRQMIEAHQNPNKQKLEFVYQENKLIIPTIERDDESLIVKFSPPSKSNPLRKAYVIAIDTSQSMLEKTSTQSQEDSGLSRIDLVKHALKSILMTLQEEDLLTVISFNNNAQIIYDLQKPNKTDFLRIMNDLQCTGQTNIYDAVRMIFEQQQKIKSYHIVSMLFTDGQPTIEPPRGTLETIKKYAKNADVKPVNCFGFGYQLNGRLLYEISRATSGWFSFISDQSMLGTVFVNFWAAQMAVCSHFSIIYNEQSKSVEVSAGVEKEVRFPIWSQKTLQITNETETIDVSTKCEKQMQPLITIFLNELAIVPTLVFEKANQKMKNLMELVSQLPDEFLQDFESDDIQKGQLSKAVSTSQFFECWGRNHIFMFCRAHQLQVCPNFYENSLQKYVSEQISDYQSIFENIYCGIPLIKHSQNQVKIERLDRNMYYNAAGGCYSGDNTVKLLNQDVIKIKDLQKGMILENGLIVKNLIISTGGSCYSNEKGLQISAYHPIKINGEWFFPIERLSQTGKLESFYNILFEDPIGKTCFVNETEVAILGHQMKGEVIEHQYFGQQVIQDLDAFNEFEIHVEWIRNGMINGLKKQ